MRIYKTISDLANDNLPLQFCIILDIQKQLKIFENEFSSGEKNFVVVMESAIDYKDLNRMFPWIKNKEPELLFEYPSLGMINKIYIISDTGNGLSLFE